MADPFANNASGLDSPGKFAAAVSPHDTNELTNHSRALYIGGAGDVKVTTVGGSTVTFNEVPAGTILPVRAKIVWENGTGATEIIAIW